MKLESVTGVGYGRPWTIMVRALYSKPIIIGPVHIEDAKIKISYCGAANRLVEYDAPVKDNWPIVVTSDEIVCVNGDIKTGTVIQHGQDIDHSETGLRINDYEMINLLLVWGISIDSIELCRTQALIGGRYSNHLINKKMPELVAAKKHNTAERIKREQNDFLVDQMMH